MRLAILGLLLVSGIAAAGTLVPLREPTLDGIGLVARTACVGSAFTSTGIVGVCHTVTSPPCSGRGCQPGTTTTNYIATWDAAGYGTGAVACNTVRHHLPQADVVSPLNNIPPEACKSVVFNPTTGTVMIGDLPFYWVATDAAGNELVNESTAGYLYENF